MLRLFLWAGIWHVLAAVALNRINSQVKMRAEVGALDEGATGVGEVLQGDMVAMRFGPAVGKERGTLPFAGFDGKP